MSQAVRSPICVFAAALVAVAITTSTVGVATSRAGDAIDDFLCYPTKAAKAARGTPPFPTFVPTSRALTDRAGDPITFDLKKALALCRPANVNGADPTAPAHEGHLRSYQLTRAKGAPKFARKGDLFEARNALHPDGLELKITGEDRVLVATSAVAGSNGAPPPPDGLADLKCYRVAVAKAPRGAPPFPTFTPVAALPIADAAVDRHFDVVKPTRLCRTVVPVGDALPAFDAAVHLVCYQVKLAKTDAKPKIETQRLSMRNDVAQEVVDVASPQEICLGSVLAPSAAVLVDALETADAYVRLAHENSPVLLRPAAEAYDPELVALIALGPAAVDAILPRFAGTAEFLDDTPLLLLAYALERIGDARAVPVLADWLERNLFAELIWAPDFVTHTIKVLAGQGGLNTTTFTYTIDEKLDAIAQARGAPLVALATSSLAAGVGVAEPEGAATCATPAIAASGAALDAAPPLTGRAAATKPNLVGTCDAKIVVTGINAMGQEEDVTLGYRTVTRDINDVIAAAANDPAELAKQEKWRTTQREVDATTYGGTSYVPVPGQDVGFASNCGGSVIERVLNAVAAKRGFPIVLGPGGSTADAIRNLAQKFGGQVGLADADETTVVSHDASGGGSAHVEVPIGGDATSVTIYSKDNYGIPRTHTVARNASLTDAFAPPIKAYDSRPWYNPFSTITTHFYKLDPNRIVGIRLDTSACPCDPKAPGAVPITIDQPTLDTTDQRVITVSGTIGDPTVTFADMKVNGAPQLVGVSDGAFFTTVVLKNGDNTIGVRVDTPSGKRGCAERTIRSTAPRTTISATLTWNLDGADVDLYVTQPDNETAWYSSKTTSIGGRLDVDNTEGLGPENYFLSSEAGNTVLPGTYVVRVHYYSDHQQDADHPTRVVSWRVVVVVNEGTPQETRQILTGQLAVASSNNGFPGSSGPDWATATQIVIPPAN